MDCPRACFNRTHLCPEPRLHEDNALQLLLQPRASQNGSPSSLHKTKCSSSIIPPVHGGSEIPGTTTSEQVQISIVAETKCINAPMNGDKSAHNNSSGKTCFVCGNLVTNIQFFLYQRVVPLPGLRIAFGAGFNGTRDLVGTM